MPVICDESHPCIMENMGGDWQDPEMDDSGRVPAAKALPGVRLHPMPEESVGIDFVFALIKFIDDDGELNWGYRTSRTPDDEELLGALRMQFLSLEHRLLQQYETVDEEADMHTKYRVNGDTTGSN